MIHYTSNLNDSPHWHRISSQTEHSSLSEEKVEVHQQMAAIVPEERAILRVADVVVHLKKIRMIAQVDSIYGEAYCMLRIDVDVLRNARVEREVAWIAWLQIRRQRNILLQFIYCLVWKAIAKLQMWGYVHTPRKFPCTPEEESIRNLSRCARQSGRTHNRISKCSKIAGYVGQHPLRKLSNVREIGVVLFVRPETCSQIELPRLSITRSTKHKCTSILCRLWLKSKLVTRIALGVANPQRT